MLWPALWAWKKYQTPPPQPSPIAGGGRVFATLAALMLVLVLAAPSARADGADDLAAAETALGARNFDEVLTLADRALAGGGLTGTALSRAHFFRARALRAGGQPKAAVDAFLAALRLSPRNVEAYSGLGRALDDQGRYAEAEQAHHRAVWLRPDLPDPYTARGDSYVLAGKFGRAVADYTRALGLAPGDAAARSGLERAKRGAQ